MDKQIGLSEEAEIVGKHGWGLADLLERGAFDLEEPYRTYCIVEYVAGLIDNGGFRYFFENNFPVGVTYTEIISAFRDVGAIESASAIETMLELYPGLNDPEDLERRRKILDDIFDEPTEASEEFELLSNSAGFDGVVAYLNSYVIRNRTRFSAA